MINHRSPLSRKRPALTFAPSPPPRAVINPNFPSRARAAHTFLLSAYNLLTTINPFSKRLAPTIPPCPLHAQATPAPHPPSPPLLHFSDLDIVYITPHRTPKTLSHGWRTHAPQSAVAPPKTPKSTIMRHPPHKTQANHAFPWRFPAPLAF